MIIYNAEVFTKDFIFKKKNIRIENGTYVKISDEMIRPGADEEVIDAGGLRLIPGLTDIHFHGCMGSDFCDATDEALTVIGRYEKSNGVMNICPATMTLPVDRLKTICKTAASHAQKEDEARLIGINLEGPFISPHKVGAQNPDYVITPDRKMLEELLDSAAGMIRLVTLAPEERDAFECINAMHEKVHFSVGHTCAGYETAARAFDTGADHVTHLFNAMPPMLHREPGVIAAAAERDGVFAEIICDGIHVHPSCVRAAFKLFGAGRMILVSDSMRACGMPDGDYELGGIPVIKKGREARGLNGTLAGSETNLYECMVYAIRMGIPAEDAVRAATYNPPASIGLGHLYGVIDEGRKAGAILTDDDWNIIRIVE